MEHQADGQAGFRAAIDEQVWAAADALAQRQAALAALCIEVQQIAAPTGAERTRADWVEAHLRRLGLADVGQDALNNVYGRVPGARSTSALLVSAHTDTVFPLETDLSIRVDDEHGRLHGPGIGDNSTGVAALLMLAATLAALPAPPVDIWLVANSGEEGLGDLRGMRAAVDRLGPALGACIVVEGMGLGRIVHRGLGSRRFRITATAPGGHSWSDFGSPSAIHTLVQLAAELAKLRVPQSPRTTFNIGRIRGGTSVNTIAQRAWLELDLRSENTEALAAVVEQALAPVHRWQTPRMRRTGVEVLLETIGDRPTGEISVEHPLVQAAVHSLLLAGVDTQPDMRISSTDANIPLSRGLPAVCIGITEGGGAHRLEEWISTEPLTRGLRHLLFLTWRTAAWLGGASA